MKINMSQYTDRAVLIPKNHSSRGCLANIHERTTEHLLFSIPMRKTLYLSNCSCASQVESARPAFIGVKSVKNIHVYQISHMRLNSYIFQSLRSYTIKKPFNYFFLMLIIVNMCTLGL